MSKAKYAASALVLSLSGLAFIQTSEGTYNKVYRDPVGILTVCTGHIGPELKLGQQYSDLVCKQLLQQDTKVAQAAVGRLVKVPVTQEQYDAVVSWTFNLGEGNLASSTMLKKMNAGDCMGAYHEMLRWHFSQGKDLPGLVIRRRAEAEMWSSGC